MEHKTQELTNSLSPSPKQQTQLQNSSLNADDQHNKQNLSSNQNQVHNNNNENVILMQKKTSDYQNLQLSSQINQKENKVKTIASLISFQDQQTYPSINLQSSSGSQKIIQLQIISYRTTTFMTMTTQIFKVKVTNPNKQEEYQIERRFSDFADLYQQLFFNHPSYILHPFPDKTVQSFLKMKLDLIIQSGEKNQLIQKRMKQLSQFINSMASHKQIRNSEQFINFIEKDEKIYQQVRNRLNKYVQEYKKLQYGSNLQSILDVGKQILSNYLIKTELKQKRFDNMKGSQQLQIIIEQKKKIDKMINQVMLLVKAERQLSEFQGMNTDIDALLKICAKHASGVDFCHKFYLFLQKNILQQLNIQQKKLQQVEKSLLHRIAIIQSIQSAEKKSDLDKKGKLQRRLQRAQRNFQMDWIQFHKRYKKNIYKIAQQFANQWKNYKMQMKKIWRAK